MAPRKKKTPVINNGLSEAIMGFQPGGIGTQLNQTDTLFKNNRWYMVSNMRQLLSESYIEHGLIQTIVDVPVDDGLRGGVEVKTKQLSEDQIEQLQVEMERNGDYINMGQALKWNRLFGGAGLLIVTDQDPMTPLDIEALNGKPLDFVAVDMWELFWSKQNTNDYAAAITSDGPDVEYFNYYGVQMHKSRVMAMTGLVAPSFVRPRLRGWGFSVVEMLINSINQYLKANNLVFEVLDEFKIDVFKVKNLVNTLLAPNGMEAVHKRVSLANLQKNYQHAITMDSEDDYITKELTFSGIAETMKGIREQVASDMRMPITKLFGVSAAGFSSGEDDIENYNSMVESQVRAKCKFDLLNMISLRCEQLFGMIPDDLSITFRPLRVLSSEQEENVKTNKFARCMQALQTGAMSVREFKEACNRDDLLPVQLDATQETLTPMADGSDGEEAAPPKGKKSTMTAPVAKNSLEYDLAEFDADGGDGLYDDRRKELYVAPQNHVDQSLWDRGVDASLKIFGHEDWKFITWFYKKRGGKFK